MVHELCSRRTVVTGGGGFLGSRIIALLRRDGRDVVSFSRSEYQWLTRAGVACYAGDITDGRAVQDALRDADLVIHAAANLDVWDDDARHHAVNVEGTRNVIRACRGNGIRRLIYTSSPSVVLDRQDARHIDENVPYPTDYLSSYAKTKALAEQLVLNANGPDLATVSLRPHFIWGPGDRQFFPRLAKLRRANRLLLVGRGRNLVDTTYVDNAATAHLKAAERLEPGSPIAGRAYFISQDDPRPFRALMDGLLQAGGLPPVTRSIPFGAAYALGWFLETLHSVAGVFNAPPLTRYIAVMAARDHYFDISAARRDLDYTPIVDIEEGLRRLGRWVSDGSPDPMDTLLFGTAS
jgi:nucleoside-diphosphate-sugar epimerase